MLYKRGWRGVNIDMEKDKIETFINGNKNDFSYVFIDCPPSLSLLTVMALVVAKSLIVPLQAEFFALEGLSQLIKTIDRIKINLLTTLLFNINTFESIKKPALKKTTNPHKNSHSKNV